MRLALFDLDGTITTKNLFIEFLVHGVGARRFRRGVGQLSPSILPHYLGLISAKSIKEIVITHFFGGMAEEEMRRLAAEFARAHVPPLVRPAALDRIRWHREQGDHVVVVSACIDVWIADWCRSHDLAFLATQLEFQGGRVTGKLASENCHGAEKVRRVRAAFDLSRVERIFAYGDSRGDREMLAMANESFYRPFHGLGAIGV